MAGDLPVGGGADDYLVNFDGKGALAAEPDAATTTSTQFPVWIISLIIAFGIRLILVLLFLPFSALDKIVNFHGAVAQASEVAEKPFIAGMLVVAGLLVEIVMSLGVLTGIADRFAAFTLAGYCVVTALLWKQFWKPGDFLDSNGKARALFWDFLKNVALAGGFLLITFGSDAASVSEFVRAPFSSTQPYRSINSASHP